MRRNGLAAVVAVMMAIGWVDAALADGFEERRAGELKAAPEGVTFEVSLEKKIYRMGEVIRITMAFSSAEEKRWQLDGGLYDRSGRMSEDAYRLDPGEGAVDPVAEYFDTGIFMGGGMRSMPMLTKTPHEMKFDVNEWQRIDRAGKYRLYVVSGRLEDLSKKEKVVNRGGVPAVSNIVEFEVVADEKWRRAELAEIEKALAVAKDETEKRAVIKRLRYLGTAESAKVLARQFNGGPTDFDCMFGLIGLRDRPAAIRAMHEALVAPDHPVTGMYLETLGKLEVWSRKLSPRPAERATQEEQQAWWSARAKVLADAQREVADELVNVIGKKEGAARSVSLLTLLQSAVSPERAEVLRAMVAEVFLEMTREQQIDALTYRWETIKSAKMLPVLLKICEGPRDDSESQLRARLVNASLRRAYELDAEKTRPVTLELMKDLPFAFDHVCRDSLLLLPDQTLPEFEAGWATMLTNGSPRMEVAMRLLARYGTEEVLNQVKEKYEPSRGRWACDVQAAMLGYFMRVDPAYGAKEVRFCVGARGNEKFSRCWSGVLGETARVTWNKELEAICVECLMDDEAEVAANAAATLKRHGSATAKGKLMEALAAPWAPAAHRENDPQQPKEPIAYREQALVTALVDGRAWVLTGEEMGKVARVATVESAKQTIDGHQKARAGKVSVQMSVGSDGVMRAYVLGVEMNSLAEVQEKLAQFPKGTVFTLVWGGLEDRDENRAALRAWAKQRSIIIEN
jgi:hypothetical protein